MGNNGPIGLDYNVVLHEIDRMGLVGEDYDDLFGSVRVMEDVALEQMRKN